MNKNSRINNSILNTLTGFIGQAVTLLASIFCRMVFVRCLDSEYLGVSSLFTSILSMLSLADLGIGSAIGFELFKGIVKKDERELAAYMQLYGKVYRIIGCIIAVVGVSVVPLLHLFVAVTSSIAEDIRLIYLLYLANTVISYFFSYKTAIINADQRGYQLTIISNISVFLMDTVQVVVLLLSHNFILYLLCQIIATLLSNIAGVILASKEYPFINGNSTYKLEREKVKRLFINVKALFISRLGSYLVNGTDSIIITALYGLSATGIISNFCLLTSALNNILMHGVRGVNASIGNVNASESQQKKMDIFWAVNLLCFWLYGWGAVSFVILSNDIVKICFGKTYQLEMLIVVVMAFNFYSAGIMNSVWMFKETMGLFKYGQYINFIMGIINVILSIGLGKIWGVFGILLATVISRGITDYWYSPYAVFRYGFGIEPKIYFKKYFKFLLALVTALCLLGLMITSLKFNFFLNFIIKLLLCIITPHLIFIYFFRKTEEFHYLLDKGRYIMDKRWNRHRHVNSSPL